MIYLLTAILVTSALSLAGVAWLIITEHKGE